MKKFISTILALSLIFTTMAFSSLTANASSTTYDYGTLLYEEHFDGTEFNTTDKTKPYWDSAFTTSSGIATITNGATIVTFPNRLTPTSGEQLVVDVRVQIPAHAQIFSMAFSTGTKETVAGFQDYNGKLISWNNGSNTLLNPFSLNTWYELKLIYDPADGLSDVLINGKCVKTNTACDQNNTPLANAGLRYLRFIKGASIDSIKVYSTKNVVNLDFDEVKVAGSFYSAKITKTNGNVSLTTEDGHGCLLIEQKSATNEQTSLELSIPSVYATADKPYIVAEGRFKNTGGNNTQLMALGSTAAVTRPSAHQIADVRQYNNFFYVIDNTNQQGSIKVKENYDGDSWVFVQIIANTTNPANVTFDVVVDGVLVQNDLVAQAQSSDNINKLTFLKNTGGASKLFVDYVNVYNATEAIVSDILYQGKTAYAAGESATLTSVVKDNNGAVITGKEVTYALKESYDGVTVSGNTITVAESAETGLFTVVASTQANGVDFSKEIEMKVASEANPYKLLSSNVTNAAVSFKLVDVSPLGAPLWSAIAIYNSDRSLKTVIPCTPSFKNHVWSENKSLTGLAGEGDFIKVFFWNSLSELKPYFAELHN